MQIPRRMADVDVTMIIAVQRTSRIGMNTCIVGSAGASEPRDFKCRPAADEKPRAMARRTEMASLYLKPMVSSSKSQ